MEAAQASVGDAMAGTPSVLRKRRRTSLAPTPPPLHTEDGGMEEGDVPGEDDEDAADVSDGDGNGTGARARVRVKDDGSAEEGEVTPAAERAAIADRVQRDLSAGAASGSVAQRDARYYMIDSVVCSHCGVKGHLSLTCPADAARPSRCFLCGGADHESSRCPTDECFVCGRGGHRAKDCPMGRGGVGGSGGGVGVGGARKRGLRDIGPPREPTLVCYVCGTRGHLDCSLGKGGGVLSCFNCGKTGHAGNGCQMQSAERVLQVFAELERERRGGRGGRGGSGGGGGSRGGRRGGGATGGGGGRGRGDDSNREERRWREPVEFRKELMDRLRMRRYGR